MRRDRRCDTRVLRWRESFQARSPFAARSVQRLTPPHSKQGALIRAVDSDSPPGKFGGERPSAESQRLGSWKTWINPNSAIQPFLVLRLRQYRYVDPQIKVPLL